MLTLGAMTVRWLSALPRGAALLCLVLSFGCSKKSDTSATTTATEVAAPATAAGAHVVVDQHGFAPASVTVPKGQAGSTVPVTFLRTTDETCAKEVVFPEVGIKKDLPLKAPVTVDVPADRARTLTFQCGMAMYKGSLVIQ
jgi:plastocyanin domain-containing protein